MENIWRSPRHRKAAIALVKRYGGSDVPAFSRSIKAKSVGKMERSAFWHTVGLYLLWPDSCQDRARWADIKNALYPVIAGRH
jgi:hypothetical protein